MSDIYCPYYKQGLMIKSTPAGQTEIAMCCWQSSQPISDTLTFDHPYLEKLREESTVAVPDSCSKYCKSSGHFLNERERASKQEGWGDQTDVVIRKLHLEQSLTCNLTCISCSPKYSSAWNKDYHLFDKNAATIKLFKDPQKIWKNLDLSGLNQIHFTGGEPLLNDDNKKILIYLDSIGRLSEVSISYNTNGTIFPDTETLELWAKSKWVRLFFSLDGAGSVFEYTRYPAKWHIVQSNIQAFRQLKSCVLIEVNAIVGIHNIFDLPNFFNWWEQNCQTGSHGDPSQIFVRQIENISYGGKVLDLKYLPTNMKSLALDLLYSLVKYQGVNDLINYVNTNSCTDNYEWVDYFNKLDSLRGTNWQKDLPYQLLMYQKIDNTPKNLYN